MTQANTTPLYRLRLVVVRENEGYTARWIEPNGQISDPFPLTLPLTPDDAAELRWYLETYFQFPGAGDHARARGIEARLRTWGQALFDAIFGTPQGTNVYRNLMDAVKDQRCLLTIGTTDPQILMQPWELLRDRRAPLAFQGVTICRQLEGSDRPQQYQLSLPLRVLLIVSRPSDIGFIDPRNSLAPLLDARDALPPGQVVINLCDPPTRAQLETMISAARREKRPYQIVHFDGHGTYLPNAGVGALAFEQANFTLDLVAGEVLGDLLARLAVPLVLLEACRTADLSDKPVVGSVAPALLQSGVGSVVAFSHSVHVQATRLLVERFYRELTHGLTVGQALEEARAGLRGDPKRWLHLGPNAETVDLQDWFVPQLYQVGDDPALIAPGTASTSERLVQLTLTIDGAPETFDAKAQRQLRYGIAGFLELDPEDVRICVIEAGSVKVTIELPKAGADKLLAAYQANDQDLASYLARFTLLDIRPGQIEQTPPVHGFPPPPLYRFHGRAQELLALERAFRRYPAALVSGMGGMGKTALAREAAFWWLRTGRFDAAVFCSFEQSAGAERVVQLLGQALEGDAFSARSAEAQWTTAVDLFHRRKVLLVWDNFESTLPIYQAGGPPTSGDQAPSGVFELPARQPATPPLPTVGEGAGGEGLPVHQPAESALSFGPEARAHLHQLYHDLTDGKPNGRLLITCRPAETGLPGLKELPLGGLARPDSLYLLAAALDMKGLTTEQLGYKRAEVDALLDLLDDHPLSIELVAPHLKGRTPERFQSEFGRLLERFTNEAAGEGRNRSLLASLAFSKRRLSAPAQAALPYLAWFAGGVFEGFLLAFAELDPQAWATIRVELVATALVSVEELARFNTPYLRFHPTLPYAAHPSDVHDPEASERRFIALYLDVMRVADKALRGSQSAVGMALLAHEEANFRFAIRRAFARGDRQAGAWMAFTLRDYLERAGRLRERDVLVAGVRSQLQEGDGLDAVTCVSIRDYAWSRFTQGHTAEAIQTIQGLITRLETEGLAGGEDQMFQIAVSNTYLGRIYDHAGRPDLAIQSTQKAIALSEQLGDAGRANLYTALGGLANAYRDLGQFDTALKAAERALALVREMGRDSEIATSFVQIAQILMGQQRYAEADARYAEALQAARAAGDLELQGAILQHQGSLQDDLGNYDRAISLYKAALALFQRASNTRGEMQTCDLLATAERARGQFDAAEAWYARSRELAVGLNDRAQLAATAQNVGILYQDRAQQTTDPETRTSMLRRAVASVAESLAIKLEMQNQVGAASSYFQLGVLYWMLGELNLAEENAQRALQIHEALNLPEVYKIYANLALIARDRSDEAAAAQWQAKRDAKWAEVQRRRGGA